VATTFARHFQRLGHQGGEFIHHALVNPELARIGPRFGRDRSGLEPEDARAAGREAAVATPGELVGRAIRAPVAAFHGLHNQPVRQAEAVYLQRLEQRADVVADL